jgi:hypothetical protein
MISIDINVDEAIGSTQTSDSPSLTSDSKREELMSAGETNMVKPFL